MVVHVKEDDFPKSTHPADMYFDLLRDILLNVFYQNLVQKCLAHGEPQAWAGRYYYTGIGAEGLNNIRYCCENVIENNIPGDFVEAGVWRGGASIYMAALAKYWQQDRRTWVLDGFQGMPKPNAENEFETTDYSDVAGLIAPLSEVRDAFYKFQVADLVTFVPGWFHESIPELEIKQISVLRLDNDYYESTMLTIKKFYPQIPVGGWIIVDDYDCVPAATTAIDHFREEMGIKDQMYRMNKITEHGVYWQKTKL